MNGLTAQRRSIDQRELSEAPTPSGLGRFIPLTGLLFVGLEIAGDLVIGPFPDSSTPTDKLVTFYSAHHAQVWLGGMLYAWAAIPLVFFGAAVWARIRASAAHPVVAAAALVGTAIAAMSQLDGSGSYLTLGTIADKSYLAPATLQTLHIGGSGGSAVGIGGIVILLFAVAMAGIVGRAFPRWLAWPALVLGVVDLTPLGFLSSLLFLVWAAVVSVVMCVRPDAPDTNSRTGGTPLPSLGT
jgi:hypothetical protein